jgi:YYY domain-containing protein
VLFVLVLPSAVVIPRAFRRLVGVEHGAVDWWGMSRVIPNSLAVTEFPAWSVLFADVHPHLIDLAVVATVLAVSIALHGALRDGPARHAVALGALAGVLVGAVRAINTWDLPLAGLLVAAALVVAVAGDRSAWRRAVAAALAAAVTMLVGWGPYTARSEVTDSWIELNTRHTPLGSWAWQFGFFAAVTLLALALVVPRAWITVRRAAASAVVVAGAAVLVVTTEWASLIVSLALAAAGVVVAVRSRHPVVGLVAAAGWGVIAVVEVVSVVNDTDRMNTVFKGWFQAWLLLAVAAAGTVAVLAGATRPWWRRATAVTALVVAGLMAVSFVQLAVPARLDDRTSPTAASLDGLAFFAAPTERLALVDPDDPEGDLGFSLAEDLPLIRWMQDHVEGIVTVAEAPGYDYTWRSRISAFTGLPTVIGWPYHETQQRRNYGVVVDEREADMNDLYASASARRIHEILQRYDIRYVVFGTVERVIAGERGRAALLASPCLTVEVESDDLFVAAVDQGCVAEQPGALPVRPAFTAS